MKAGEPNRTAQGKGIEKNRGVYRKWGRRKRQSEMRVSWRGTHHRHKPWKYNDAARKEYLFGGGRGY